MTKRGVALFLVLVAGACGPSEDADDTAVDASGDALVTGRDFNVDCVAERYEVRSPNGDLRVDVTWVAVIEQPFDWHAVSYRLCNPNLQPNPRDCPAGATCTGTPPIAPAFCYTDTTFFQDVRGDDPGRIVCGRTTSNTPFGGTTTTSGLYYRLAQIHID